VIVTGGIGIWLSVLALNHGCGDEGQGLRVVPSSSSSVASSTQLSSTNFVTLTRTQTYATTDTVDLTSTDVETRLLTVTNQLTKTETATVSAPVPSVSLQGQFAVTCNAERALNGEPIAFAYSDIFALEQAQNGSQLFKDIFGFAGALDRNQRGQYVWKASALTSNVVPQSIYSLVGEKTPVFYKQIALEADCASAILSVVSDGGCEVDAVCDVTPIA